MAAALAFAAGLPLWTVSFGARVPAATIQDAAQQQPKIVRCQASQPRKPLQSCKPVALRPQRAHSMRVSDETTSPLQTGDASERACSALDHPSAGGGTSSVGREVLSCRIKGFYPFPGDVPAGVFGWLVRDTHQAISVRTSAGSDSLFMDFMTEGGAAHPVWWDETVKWQVLFGQNIGGEVRIRVTGEGGAPGSKLQRLRETAEAYAERPLNLYFSNCRIFCARMEREVERLNAEDVQPPAGEEAQSRLAGLDLRSRTAELKADARLAAAILRAGTLPLLYPAGVTLLCWDGLRDLL